MSAPERDDREPPFDEWLAKAEARKTFSGFDYKRALREIRRLQEDCRQWRGNYEALAIENDRTHEELRRLQAENERLRAQAAGLNDEAEALHKMLVEHHIVDP